MANAISRGKRVLIIVQAHSTIPLADQLSILVPTYKVNKWNGESAPPPAHRTHPAQGPVPFAHHPRARNTATSRAGIGVKFARSVRSPVGVVVTDRDEKGARRIL